MYCNGRIMKSTYIKSTKFGATINYKTEWPERYKISAITTLLNRFFKICSSWDSINNEINGLKKVFINNRYSNSIFDRTVEKFLNNKNIKNEKLTRKTLSIYSMKIK